MKLKEVLKDVEYKGSSVFPRGQDIDIKGISSDSKTARGENLFIAVSGTAFDGHKFVNEAADKGCVAVVLEKDIAIPDGIAKIFVRDSRAAAPKIANNFFGRPAGKMKGVGINRTNGKTTISYLMDSIVSAAGHRAGVIGTISYRIGKRVIPATNTTHGPIDLYSFMSEMVRNSSDYLLM